MHKGKDQYFIADWIKKRQRDPKQTPSILFSRNLRGPLQK